MTALDLHYHLARIDACLSDDTVSAEQFRLWMEETLLDMQEAYNKNYPLTEEQTTLVTQAAADQQAYIFHGAPDNPLPDPVENPTYREIFYEQSARDAS